MQRNKTARRQAATPGENVGPDSAAGPVVTGRALSASAIEASFAVADRNLLYFIGFTPRSEKGKIILQRSKIWVSILIFVPIFASKEAIGLARRYPRRRHAPERKETTMTEQVETNAITPKEVLRKGWLAYLGLYGAAYERVKPLTTKAGDTLEQLIAKGETVETKTQEVAGDVRERANSFYGKGATRVRRFIPEFVTGAERVDELEAEIAALSKKVAELTGAPEADSAKAA